MDGKIPMTISVPADILLARAENTYNVFTRRHDRGMKELCDFVRSNETYVSRWFRKPRKVSLIDYVDYLTYIGGHYANAFANQQDVETYKRPFINEAHKFFPDVDWEKIDNLVAEVKMCKEIIRYALDLNRQLNFVGGFEVSIPFEMYATVVVRQVEDED